ncbi:MAG TPA: acetyl-CoA C-acyltransferase [Herpetosiphonaceae bacterium]
MSLPRVIIASAVRTPIGKFMGGLSSLSAADLGAAAARAALERAGVADIAARIGVTIMGCGRQAGSGPNVARQISIRAGVPDSVPAWTVNQACASGLLSIVQGMEAIQLGRVEAALVGGTESMSRLPFFLDRFREGYRLGNAQVVDGMYRDGFHDPIADMLMGETAEKLAGLYGISREEQDAYALRSQQRAEAAWNAGAFADEIVPVEVPGKRGPDLIERDEHPRFGASIESMRKLPPVFSKDGTVSAGNSSGITDGAAALVLMSAAFAERHGVAPLAELGEYEMAGVDPSIMGIGPVPALRQLEARTGRKLGDYDLVELNEAFAAQVIACDRDLGFDPERLNVNGGAIALGHPIGCTGTRIVVTLLHELRRRGGRHGLATLCVSGGQGFALEVRREA